MNLNEMMIGNMLFNSISKSKSVMESVYLIFITTIFYYISKINFKTEFFENLFDFDKTNKLVYSSTSKNTSKRFRAIMYYISKKKDISIKKLIEIIDIKYSYKTESYEETKKTGYRVDQITKFMIDSNIYGRIYSKEKEVVNESGKSKFEEIIYLQVFSNNLSLLSLQEWVETKLKEYETYIKSKNIDNQLLVEIGWNKENKEIEVIYNQWESNVTFNNRFFTNKDKIIDKIKFFIDNPDWYRNRGIPYTLGFLLWGKPGCGKTGFIKALMNLTNKNAISIKLNNKFDLNELKKIMYNDEINEDLIIPQKNRILIFEDIDCMSDIVLDREIKNNDKKILEEALKIKCKDLPEKLDIIDSHDNNNLSYFLNILDGLQECPGRIIIMTTNKPEVLDSALIRSGRIDYKIEFTFATIKDVEDILNFYWDNNQVLTLDSDIHLKYSHADIINFCRSSDSLSETLTKI
jgi:chaperone BCS1